MKSACQVRLEERREAEKESVQASWERVNEARRKRRQQLSERRLMAHSHVSKAISIAKAVHEEAQSRADDQLAKLQDRLEAAEQRRVERLTQTTQQCQLRYEHVLSTVQQQAHRMDEKRKLYDESLHAAHHRRVQLKLEYVSKLSRHARRVERVQARRSQAAKQLQTWFRSWKRVRQAFTVALPLIPAMQNVVSTWDQMSNSTFEKSMGIVQNRKCAAAANAITKTLCSTPMNYRVLLMAGMMKYHPNDTMEDIGFSAALACAASRVVDELTTMHQTLKTRSLVSFASSWKHWEAYCLSYQALFNSWKSKNHSKMDAEMIKLYGEVYKLHLQAMKTEDQDIYNKSKQQLEQLRASIEQSFGATVAKTKLAEVEATIEASLKPKKEEKASPPSSPIRKPISKPDLEFTKEVFANDKLAHELILNPDYQMPSQQDDQLLQSRIATTMRQVFWEQLAASKDRNRVVSTFVELRDELSSVLKHKALRNAVPIEHLTNLASNAVWDEWVKVFDLFLDAILRGEAPVRNSSTVEWRERLHAMNAPSSKEEWFAFVIEFLKFGFEKVNEIQIDSINAHLKALAPYVARHGVEHEQKKFAQKLEAGVIQLDQTAKWLKIYVANASEQLRSSLASGDRAAFHSLYQEAFISLISKHVADLSLWPETFEMDKERIRSIRNQVDLVAIQATILTLLQGVFS
ncbi:hypothetical protein THRCLA_23319, partial [Thraustotheca clavata]